MARRVLKRSRSAPRRKRALITGGAGFLGSHLCDHLLASGFEVVCVDNLLTGSSGNLEHIRDRAFTFVEKDVTGGIFVDGPLDYVLHFASPASPKDYLELPIQTLMVGSLGTHRALGLARAKKATFLLASTSEVYGDPLEHPQKETYWGNVNPVGPRGVYDEAKRFAEALTVAYRTTHGLNTKIARIFNTYGPRMRLNDGRAIPAFVSQALLGKPLTVFGDGRQTRSFCYIDDMIEGLFRLLVSDHPGPMNLGNPAELSLLDMASKIKALAGSKSGVAHRPLPTDDPKIRQPDISLARRVLDWSPRVGLDEGLGKTILYFRGRLLDGGRS